MMNITVSCMRCAFTFRSKFSAKVYTCPACGAKMSIKDDIKGLEPREYMYKRGSTRKN